MSELRFDHAVHVTEALASAGASAASAGLSVRGGGRHQGLPTENALVPLGDAVYLEFLALQRADDRAALRALDESGWNAREPLARRFLRAFTGADGIADVVLRAPDLDGAIARLRAAGIAVPEPAPMGRTRPDGVALAWRLAVPEARHLPMLIADSTPLELRVPQAAADAPPPPRAVALTIACDDPDRAIRDWAVLLAAPPAPQYALGLLHVRFVARTHAQLLTGACALTLAPRPASADAAAVAALAAQGLRYA